MELSQNISLETKQILSQSQIQSLEILAMDAIELEEFLQNEYMSNPLLDCNLNNTVRSGNDQEVCWFDNTLHKGRRYMDEDEDLDVRDNLIAPDTDYLKKYFLDQIELGAFSDKEWKLAEYLIDCLEDDGFFRMSMEEVTKLTGLPDKMVEKVLNRLKNLEPFGVFAVDLSECLFKQLEAMGEEDQGLLLVVKKYLPELSEGKISVISRQTGFSTAQIRRYIAKIAKLNPKPLSGLQQAEINYIVPDIVYTFKSGQWEIAVNDVCSGNYHINEHYVQMMRKTSDTELIDYFKKNLERCRFILNSVEQRKETMKSIAGAILTYQEQYLAGKGNPAPMTMCMLAKELHIHPSTVSRAVKGKYIKSPVGTILMKKLFSSVVTCEKGEERSSAHIKDRIRMLVKEEDKHRPYSDAKLVELLVKEGIHVSRRAVAKYRDELWIKSSFDRKIR